MKKILMAALVAVTVANAGNEYVYYQDGIYDAYSQINKDIKDGLKENIVKDLADKYLVEVNLKSYSLVDLIFFKAIAQKNQMFNTVVVKDLGDGENYIVFDAYQRKADAVYAANKLEESGISAKITFNEGRKLRQNPLVIKKIIGDIKNELSDAPVKMVVIEKRIPINVYGAGAGAGAETVKQIYQAEFDRLQREWDDHGLFSTRGGTAKIMLKREGRWENMASYMRGDYYGSLKFESMAYVAPRVFKVKLVDPNGEAYYMSKTINRAATAKPTRTDSKPVRPVAAKPEQATTHLPPKDDCPPCEKLEKQKEAASQAATPPQPSDKSSRASQDEPSAQVSSPPTTAAAPSPSSGESVTCHFEKISSLMQENGEFVDTKQTGYLHVSGKKIEVLGTKGKYVIVKADSLPPMAMRKNYFDSHCER